MGIFQVLKIKVMLFFSSLNRRNGENIYSTQDLTMNLSKIIHV